MSQRFILTLILMASYAGSGCSSKPEAVNLRAQNGHLAGADAARMGGEDAKLECRAPELALQVVAADACPGGRYPNGDFHADEEPGLRLADSGDIRIDSISSGTKVELVNGTITYSFYNDAIYQGRYYGQDEKEVKEVDDIVKENVREIMRNMEKVLPIKFVEVKETSALVGAIRILRAKNTKSTLLAYAYYPWAKGINNVGSDLVLSESWYQQKYFHEQAGQKGYLTIIHELGHALGLRHPFDSDKKLPEPQQNDAHTVMSYNRPTDYVATTFMRNDLLALKTLYGMRPDYKSPVELKFTQTYRFEGDTSYRAELSRRMTLQYSEPIKKLNLEALPAIDKGYHIDLKPGGLLVKLAETPTPAKDYFGPGTAFSFETKVQDFVSSPSNDTVFANDLANVFGGYHPAKVTGHDTIFDAKPDDTIDLSMYYESKVQRKEANGDLVLTLRPDSSVTIRKYDAKAPVKILFKAVPDVLLSLGGLVIKAEGSQAKITLPLLLSEALAEDAEITYELTPKAGQASQAEALNGAIVFNAGKAAAEISLQLPLAEVNTDLTYELHLTPAANLHLVEDTYQMIISANELNALRPPVLAKQCP